MDQIQPEEIPFSRMTTSQRDRVLVELGKSLSYTALVSRTFSTSHHSRLEELSRRIEADHAELAADADAAAELVSEALHLIATFEYEMGRGETIH